MARTRLREVHPTIYTREEQSQLLLEKTVAIQVRYNKNLWIKNNNYTEVDKLFVASGT